ncbi:MAG: ROK family protein [Mucilaginibacter sp.]
MQNNNLLARHILTADIGGSHITLGICDLETYTIHDEAVTRAEVDSGGSASEILNAWRDAFRQLLNKNSAIPFSGLSVAMPGPFDYQNGISYITGLKKYEALYGMDIRHFFADLLKIDPKLIRFRNDAESTIAGEILAGAGKGFQRIMGVTLGTGFGSAYCENGVTNDINLGSKPFKDSIADDHLSTRWFLKRYYEGTGMELTDGVKQLAELAPGNPVARDIFREFALNMVDFLSGPVQQLEPSVLVVCGNIAKASEFFMPYLTKGLPGLTIKLARLGENAPLIGAAAMFNDMGGQAPPKSITCP